MKRTAIALLVAMLVLPMAGRADDDEAAARLREEQLHARFEQAFGADWQTRVAAYEDYDFSAAYDDGALFAVTSDEGQNALHIVEFAGGEIVSHIENPQAVRQDEVPSFYCEIEVEIEISYASGEWQTYARDDAGRWRIIRFGAGEAEGGAMQVNLRDVPVIRYAVYRPQGESAQSKTLAGWPRFAVCADEVDLARLPANENELIEAISTENGDRTAYLAQAELDGVRLSAACIASAQGCELAVSLSVTREGIFPEELGLASYRVLADDTPLANVEVPTQSWDGNIY